MNVMAERGEYDCRASVPEEKWLTKVGGEMVELPGRELLERGPFVLRREEEDRRR